MSFRQIIYSVLIYLLANSAYADSQYLQKLQEQAQQLKLSSLPEWHNLLHYKKNSLFGGVTSQVDGQTFFNAKNGKTDPDAELLATLQAFFEPAVTSEDAQHKQCLFSARFHWLNQKLQFDPNLLPKRSCSKLQTWMDALNPAGITLIFPSAYLNNPASMFGHTFLRIDGKTQDEKTRLLAYTISYAAGTRESNGIVFAMKGIFGGYPGEFSVLPYYMKVKEYSELENRDVWEYQLNLEVHEIQQLLRHAWELRYTYFDYYFFDENCAYHLLSLLDVARPGLNLTQEINYWAIPTDTLRITVKKQGLLNNIVYRPALSTQLQYRLENFDQNQEKTLEQFMQNEISLEHASIKNLPARKRFDFLSTAYDLTEFRRISEGQSDDLSNQQLEILKNRSSIKDPLNELVIPTPDYRPEQGHATGRISLGLGTDDDQTFSEFEFRPAYHDLLDPPQGYSEGAELKFATLTARYYEATNDFELQDLTLVGIKSIAPRKRFIQPISWKMNFGLNRKQVSKKDDILVGRFQGGPGYSWSFIKNTAVYGLLDGIVEAGDELKNKHAIGAGIDIGMLGQINPHWSMHLSAQTYRYFLGHDHKRFDINFEQRISLNESNTLRVQLSRHRLFDYYRTEAEFSWQYFF